MISIKNLVREVIEKDDEDSMKRKTIAFVGGSLKPPHRGHWDMVEEYAQFADQVVVLISTPSAKSARKTKLGTIISPEQAKEILEIYKDAYHLDNVVIDISQKPSPLMGIIDYMNRNKVKDANIILGASDKDDDWKRWTADYVKDIMKRIENEPNNIRFLDPQQYTTHHHSSNKGATYVRDHIDDFDVVKEYLPTKLDAKQQKQVFRILNPQLNVNEDLNTKRTGLVKIPKLSAAQTKDIFEKIKTDLMSEDGYELIVNPKSDGSAVRIAWNADKMYIENSHSGLVDDPSKMKISSFKNTLIYLQKKEVKSRFDKLLSEDLTGIKLIGELLYNSEEDRDEDGGITFVATTYDSAKLGKIASIVVFEIMSMSDSELEKISVDKQNELMNRLINDVSDENITFIDNKSFKVAVPLKYSDFSDVGKHTIDNLDKVGKVELESLRDELNYQIVKICDELKKPDIIKGDVVEGLVFELAGHEYAVQSEKWVQRKHDIYQYGNAYDEVIVKFMKELTGFQMRKKILSIFDANKDKWQEKYSQLLPKFKEDLTKAYDDFNAHRSDIPRFVYNINKLFIDGSYGRFMKMTDDISTLKDAIQPIKSESQIQESLVSEGGHLFNGEVSRINQENVEATLNDIYDKVLPIYKLDKEHTAVLGTTGKKLPGGSSGDIDLGVDLTYTNKKIHIGNYDDFKQYSEEKLSELGVEFKAVPQFRVVSLKWPITNVDGKQEGQFVQLDLMPVYDLNWIKFGEGHPHERIEKWKGAVRNQILMGIAAYRDKKDTKWLNIDGKKIPVEFQRYSFSPRDGLFRQTFSIEGKKDPTKLLKNPKKVSEVLYTSDVKKVLSTLMGTDDVNIDDFTTTIGTWEQFKKTDLWKDEELRNRIIARAVNELRRVGIDYPTEIDNALTDKSLLRESLICEGGNAVSNVSRINKANVEATVQDVYDRLLSLLKIKKADISLLGSSGKKDTSGDLDIGIDKIDDIRKFLSDVEKICTENNIECKATYGLNEISVRWPIANADGKQKGLFVQVDLMLAKNLNMLKWGMHSPTQEESEYKGVVRNLLLCDIAAFKDRKIIEQANVNGKTQPVVYERYVLLTSSGLYRKTYSYKGKKPGTIKKTPDKINSRFITDDPNKIVNLIFGSSVKPEDVMTIDDLWKEFMKTEMYKDPTIRRAILNKTITEIHNRPGLKYPSYMDSAIVESCSNSTFEDPLKPLDETEDIHIDINDSLLSQAKIAAYNVGQTLPDQDKPGKEVPVNPKRFPTKAVTIIIPLDDVAAIKMFFDTELKGWNSDVKYNGQHVKLSPDQFEGFFTSRFYQRMLDKFEREWPLSDKFYGELYEGLANKQMIVGPTDALNEGNDKDMANKDVTGDGVRDFTASGRKIIHFSDTNVSTKGAQFFCWPNIKKLDAASTWKDWKKLRPLCRMRFMYNGVPIGLTISPIKEDRDVKFRGFRGYDLDPKLTPVQWLTKEENEQVMRLSIVNKFIKHCAEKLNKFANFPPEEVLKQLKDPTSVTVDEIEATQRHIRKTIPVIKAKQVDSFKWR